MSRRTDRLSSPVAEVSDAIAENVGQLGAQVDHESKRVKTRFLKFFFNDESKPEERIEEDVCVTEPTENELPLGRLAIIEGKGRGRTFALTSVTTRIGRADGQEVQLAFGDDCVSRDCHATIVHYGKGLASVIRDGMKPNPVILNGRLLRGDRNLNDGDVIRIGATTLLFNK